MTRRVRLAIELGILCAVLALLALAAFAGQRIFFPQPAPSPDVAAALDKGLGPIMREQIGATETVVDDPQVRTGFSAIMGRLLAARPEPKMPVEVLVILSPDINAFTLPGGVICVDTGLIRALPSAEEMAGVLAHELSHVVKRDPLSLLARQLGMAALVSAVSGGQGSTLTASLVQTVVNARYGREAEDRADSFSVNLLARAGIMPDSFARALKRIKETGPKQPGLLKYFEPHSPIDTRIARAIALAERQACVPRALPFVWRKLVEALPAP